MVQYKISFAGAGNVAEALCKELYNKGYLIQQIVSQSEKNSSGLVEICNAKWSSDLTFPDSTEIIFVSVPDQSLKDVLFKIKCKKDTIVAHTAGSFGLDIFPLYFENTGVFYPLQTFSKERKTDFSTVPFFIEASNDFSTRALRSVAESISKSVHFSDTEHRRLLHMAAVFVSNFTNHMFVTGMLISSKAGFPFEILKPLIRETVEKALELGPEKSQTGPAVRYDIDTIERHMDLLSFSPELKNVYGEITKSIISYHKKN